MGGSRKEWILSVYSRDVTNGCVRLKSTLVQGSLPMVSPQSYLGFSLFHF